MRAPYSAMTIDSARRRLTRSFSDHNITSAALDARLLIEHVTALSPADLIAQGADALSREDYEQINRFAERRLSGEPVDMILGYKDFWKDRFTVSKDVLSPRPETEGIIEQALRVLAPNLEHHPRILELGVGSGALILSLLREYKGAQAVGVDVSEAALDIARSNARALGLECQFLNSDWLSAVTGNFDLIVSNPPYITDEEMKDLPKSVSLHDPHLALRGGADGLDPYRIIIKGGAKHLNPHGYLIFEIGARQGRAVADLMSSAGYMSVQVVKDLAGHDRIVCGQNTKTVQP